MTNNVEVIALEPGHDGRMYRTLGEKFHVSRERLEKGGDTWFVEVGKAPPPKPAPKDKRPPGAGPLKGSQVGDGATPGAGPDAAG